MMTTLETLHEVLREQAKRRPRQPAVVSVSEGELAYAELDRRSELVANALLKRGLGPRKVVALSVPRSFDLLTALFGILKAGNVCVPVDPEEPSSRREMILGHCEPAFVMTPESLAVLMAEGTTAEASRIVEGQAPAFVFYTSGSTGQAKGVVLSHGALLSGQRWLQRTFPLAEGDRHILRTTIGVTNLVREVFWPILAGGTIVLVPPGGHRDPALLVELLNRFEVATVLVVPALLAGMLDQPGFRRNRSLKYLFCSSDVMPGDLAVRYFETGIAADLYNLYGLTEALYCLYWRCKAGERYDGFVPVGGRAELEARILDEGLHPVAPGTSGELCVAGVGIADCYLKDEALTRARFFEDACGRNYRTGDVARQREDGVIELLGRSDDQVKVAGHRVELGEVEAALSALPGVKTAVVVGRRGASGHQRLVAFFVSSDPTALHANAMRNRLADHLPDYMIPAAFVSLDAIPLTHNGKVDRRALKELRAEPLELAEEYAPPTNEVQRYFCELWAQVLELSRVGVHDNFFALGGDSIQGFLISARASRAGFPIGATQVFDTPTVAELSRAFEGARRAPAKGAKGLEAPTTNDTRAWPVRLGWSDDSIARLNEVLRNLADVADVFPLTHMQRGMLFHSLLDPTSGVYFEQFLYTLRGDLDIARFERAWREVARRHDILRCAIVADGLPEPLHVVHGAPALEVRTEDWSEVPATETGSRLTEFLRDDRRRGFEFSRPPLLRLSLMRTAPREWRLLMSYHHLILDAWSLFVMLTESLEIYRSLRDGDEAKLNPPRSFRDYVAWLAQAPTNAARDYWRGRMAGLTQPTVVGGRSSPGLFASTLEEHAETRLDLTAEETRDLKRYAREQRLTLNTVVQGAWALTLARLSRRDEVCFGITITHRPVDLAGVEAMVGIFINSLPLRLTVTTESTVADWLHDLQEGQVRARTHDHYPLPLVQQDSDMPGDQPLFETLLIFENFPRGSDWKAKGGIQIEQDRYVGWTNYPFALEAMLDETLYFQVKHDLAFFDEPRVVHLLGVFREALVRIARGDAQDVSDLTGALTPLRAVDGAAQIPRRGQMTLPKADHRVAPANDAERRLAAIWSHVLRRNVDDTRTAFLLFGGSSLSAMSVLALSREEGFDFELKDLFGADATIHALTRG